MTYEHDSYFDTEQNQVLMAICARKLITNTGIGAVIWGGLNLLIGAVAVIEDPINVGIIVLGVMMLGTGIMALKKPTIDVLIKETAVAVFLFAWNFAMTIYNYKLTGEVYAQGLIFPVIIAVGFYNSHKKLKPIESLIENVPTEKIAETKTMCKALVKKKLKEEPLIIQNHDRKLRAQLLPGSAFFIERSMMKAFIIPANSLQTAIVKPDAKKVKILINHPLEKKTYHFDKKNTEKIKNWLEQNQATEEPPALQED